MINENIRHFRKAKGISQEEMAVKLNVVRQTVSKWENGLSVPDVDVLIHMANLLDVSVSQLLGNISFPVVLLYIACTWTISNFEIVTLCAMIVWLGIPGGISYVHFHKKFRGNLR